MLNHGFHKESYHLSWLLVLWSKFNWPCSKFVCSYWKIVAKALRNQVATDKETFWCWSDWAALHPPNTMTCHTVILSCMCSKSIVLNLWYDSGKEKELQGLYEVWLPHRKYTNCLLTLLLPGIFYVKFLNCTVWVTQGATRWCM